MKKLIYLPFMISAMLMTGCDSFLNQQPVSELSEEKFWRTADDARLGNAAIYDALQRTLSGNYTDWGDARSDNFTYSGTGENQIIITLNGLNSTTDAANWDNLYRTIARANLSIKYLPQIPDIIENQRNNYLAQAYALRAYMYFYAIRIWGAVPVTLTPYEDIEEEPRLPRTSADSILNNVILPDLNHAYELSDKSLAGNSQYVWEVTAGGILAILTEVYMWKKDYPQVIATADKLLALNKYALAAAADWKRMFIDHGTRENIWSLYWDNLVDGGNGISKIGSGSNTSAYQIDSVALQLFERNKQDIRRHITYDTLLLPMSGGVNKIWKFYGPGADGRPAYPANNVNSARLPLYRLADILLLKAEALNMTGNRKGAIDIVNQVRARANTTLLNEADYATQRDVETVVLQERQMELFAEGKRWFDLVRTDRVLEVMDPLIRKRQAQLNLEPTGFTDKRKILFPVSRDALTRNNLLTQNPPYSE